MSLLRSKSPVHEAAKCNDVDELRRLLDEDPLLLNAPDPDNYKRSPLHVACMSGSVDAARLLLDRGAEVGAGNQYGVTPLMRACENGRVGVVSLLLERGADPTMPDSCQWTALTYAAAVVNHGCWGGEAGKDFVGVMRMLIEDGRVPVDAPDKYQRTALWWACSRGHTDRARVLLVEGGADYRLACHDGKTPMKMASQGRHGECVKLITWCERKMKRTFLLSRARAVVEARECITKAAERVGAKTEEEAQKAREEAAPAYLRGRVSRGEALPEVEVKGREVKRRRQEEEGRRAVMEFVVRWLKEDLFVELLQGLQLQ